MQEFLLKNTNFDPENELTVFCAQHLPGSDDLRTHNLLIPPRFWVDKPKKEDRHAVTAE